MTERLFDLRHTVIISHADGGFNRRHGTAQVESAAQEAQVPHHRVHTLQQLDEALFLCPKSTSLIVINAGDGTVGRIVEQLRNRRIFSQEPHLALLRGGTTNLIHQDVGWRGEPSSAARRLLTGIRNGGVAVWTRQPLRVQQTEQPARFGFFFATNALVRGILQARNQLHSRGLTGRASEILSVLRVLGKLVLKRVENDPVLAPVAIELSVDGQAGEKQKQIFLLAFTLRKLILGIRPLREDQVSGLAALNWPDDSVHPWLQKLLGRKISEFDVLTLGGNFSWILDGEIYHHTLDEGPLKIGLDRPVRFLVRER